MRYNYPIKYACMPIYEATGWYGSLNQLEKEYEVVGYITSKCYVVNEKIIYNNDGSKKSEYEVVFPYQKTPNDSLDSLKRVFPEFSLYGQCTNSNIVNEVFDTFSEAKLKPNLFNDKIIINSTAFISFDENFLNNVEAIRKENNDRLARYLQFENKIEMNTMEMVNKPIKPQNVIVMFEKEDKILPISLYEFMELYKDKSYLVCNVSQVDFQKQINQIKKDGKLYERDLNKTNTYYDQSNYLLAKRKNDEIVRIANGIDNIMDGSYCLTNNIYLYYNEKMVSFDKDETFMETFNYEIKVYTVETFKDVIDSYKCENIKLDNPKILIK